MQKKILNLILSGVLLLQFSCFSIFTVSTYSFSVGTHPAWRDVCKDYPKNQYNQTVDTNCAFFQLLNDQRVTDGRSSGEKTRIGPNGEHEIKMWHIDQIKGLGKEFANLILARNKEAQKDEYIRSLSDTTNNFLMLNSEEEADRVTSKLLENSPYFKNKGATIPEYKLERIFDKFYRADESRQTNNGGAGLGLAITKEIIELHNGKICAKSNDEFIEFQIELKK